MYYTCDDCGRSFSDNEEGKMVIEDNICYCPDCTEDED